MSDIIDGAVKIFIIIIGVLMTSTFISLSTYLIRKISKTDYSDQTGWKNFGKPFLSVALSALAIQLIIIGIVLAAVYFSG